MRIVPVLVILSILAVSCKKESENFSVTGDWQITSQTYDYYNSKDIKLKTDYVSPSQEITHTLTAYKYNVKHHDSIIRTANYKVESRKGKTYLSMFQESDGVKYTFAEYELKHLDAHTMHWYMKDGVTYADSDLATERAVYLENNIYFKRK